MSYRHEPHPDTWPAHADGGKMEDCSECEGRGYVEPAEGEIEDCRSCEGRGYSRAAPS